MHNRISLTSWIFDSHAAAAAAAAVAAACYSAISCNLQRQTCRLMAPDYTLLVLLLFLSHVLALSTQVWH